MSKRIFLTVLVIITMLTDIMTSFGRAVSLYPISLSAALPVESEQTHSPTTTDAPEADVPREGATSPSAITPLPSGITSPSGITAPSDVGVPPAVTPPSGIVSPSENASPPGITAPLDPSGYENATPPAIIENAPESDPHGPLVLQLPSQDPTTPEVIDFYSHMEAIVQKAVKKSGIKGTFGLFVMDLTNEYYYGINENKTVLDPKDQVPEGYFNSASVIKLFQGYIFSDMIRRGELDADKTYYDKVTGRKFKLLPMIKSMISYSDNNYSNACLRLVDNKRSNEVLARLGIVNSRLYGEMSGAIGYSRENNIAKYGTDKRCARITPADTALILYNIFKNKDTDEYMKALNDALLKSIYNTRIPVGVHRVSSKYAIAHKTGTNSAIGVYNDAGIVYTPNPYILVVFTQGTTSNIGHTFIRSLAEQLTRYFTKEKA